MKSKKTIAEIFSKEEIEQIRAILEIERSKELTNQFDGYKREAINGYCEKLEDVQDNISFRNIYVILKENKSKLCKKLEWYMS